MICSLSQQEVHHLHEAEACQQGIGGGAGTVMVRLGDHFIGDYVEHGAACKNRCKENIAAVFQGGEDQPPHRPKRPTPPTTRAGSNVIFI